jgi:hypothetical protein
MNRASMAARARWARIIREQRESGLSVGVFCARRSIPTSSLFAWRRRLGEAAPVFVEARVRGVDDERGGGGGGVGGVAVRLGGGRHVTVVRGFDRRLLLEVIDALESGGREAADGARGGGA